MSCTSNLSHAFFLRGGIQFDFLGVRFNLIDGDLNDSMTLRLVLCGDACFKGLKNLRALVGLGVQVLGFFPTWCLGWGWGEVRIEWVYYLKW